MRYDAVVKFSNRVRIQVFFFDTREEAERATYSEPVDWVKIYEVKGATQKMNLDKRFLLTVLFGGWYEVNGFDTREEAAAAEAEYKTWNNYEDSILLDTMM